MKFSRSCRLISQSRTDIEGVLSCLDQKTNRRSEEEEKKKKKIASGEERKCHKSLSVFLMHGSHQAETTYNDLYENLLRKD